MDQKCALDQCDKPARYGKMCCCLSHSRKLGGQRGSAIAKTKPKKSYIITKTEYLKPKTYKYKKEYYSNIPFLDRYKKFSWRDRPMVTAFGITSLAQIMVTTYWGFYISPDVSIPLVERLVIDPIFFYGVMILLVPLGFGFTYILSKL